MKRITSLFILSIVLVIFIVSVFLSKVNNSKKDQDIINLRLSVPNYQGAQVSYGYHSGKGQLFTDSYSTTAESYSSGFELTKTYDKKQVLEFYNNYFVSDNWEQVFFDIPNSNGFYQAQYSKENIRISIYFESTTEDDPNNPDWTIQFSRVSY